MVRRDTPFYPVEREVLAGTDLTESRIDVLVTALAAVETE